MVSEHASPLSDLGGVDAGGQNVHVGALAAHLAALGHDVEVATRRTDAALPDDVRVAAGFVVHHVPAGRPVPISKDDLPPLMPEFAAHLRARWQQSPPDIIHTHFWMSGTAGLDARPATTPLVHTYHALGVVRRRHQGSQGALGAAREAAEQRILAEADGIIATCSDEVRELRAIGGRQRAIDVVPCGVDLSMFTPHGSCMPPTGRSLAVCVSRLVPRKGIGDVIEALADVPGCDLVVIGGPPADQLAADDEHRRLTELAAQRGVADRVHFTGGLSQPEVATWMRSADLVIAVPWYEPFGIVPLEAMACAKPVIGSAVGGLLDTVEPGRTGILVPPRSPGALAVAWQQLLRDGPRRARMGDAAHRRACRDFPWHVVARRTLAAYQRVGSRYAELVRSS